MIIPKSFKAFLIYHVKIQNTLWGDFLNLKNRFKSLSL